MKTKSAIQDEANALLMPGETCAVTDSVAVSRGRFCVVLRSPADQRGMGDFWGEDHAITLPQLITGLRKHLLV